MNFSTNSEELGNKIEDEKIGVQEALLSIDIQIEDVEKICNFIEKFKSTHTYGWKRDIESGAARVVNLNGHLFLKVDPTYSKSYDCWSGSAVLNNYLHKLNLGEKFTVGLVSVDEQPMTAHFRAFILNRETQEAITLDMTPLFKCAKKVDINELISESEHVPILSPIDLNANRATHKSLANGIVLESQGKRFIQVELGDNDHKGLPTFTYQAYKIGRMPFYESGSYIIAGEEVARVNRHTAYVYNNWTEHDEIRPIMRVNSTHKLMGTISKNNNSVVEKLIGQVLARK